MGLSIKTSKQAANEWAFPYKHSLVACGLSKQTPLWGQVEKTSEWTVQFASVENLITNGLCAWSPCPGEQPPLPETQSFPMCI